MTFKLNLAGWGTIQKWISYGIFLKVLVAEPENVVVWANQQSDVSQTIYLSNIYYLICVADSTIDPWDMMQNSSRVHEDMKLTLEMGSVDDLSFLSFRQDRSFKRSINQKIKRGLGNTNSNKVLFQHTSEGNLFTI